MELVKTLGAAFGISLATATLIAVIKKWWGLSKRWKRISVSIVALTLLATCITLTQRAELLHSRLAGPASFGVVLFVHSPGHAVTTDLVAANGDVLTYA